MATPEEGHDDKISQMVAQAMVDAQKDAANLKAQYMDIVCKYMPDERMIEEFGLDAIRPLVTHCTMFLLNLQVAAVGMRTFKYSSSPKSKKALEGLIESEFKSGFWSADFYGDILDHIQQSQMYREIFEEEVGICKDRVSLN